MVSIEIILTLKILIAILVELPIVIEIIVAVPILFAILEIIAILIALLEPITIIIAIVGLIAINIAIIELIAIIIAILELIARIIAILELIGIIIVILLLQYIATTIYCSLPLIFPSAAFYALLDLLYLFLVELSGQNGRCGISWPLNFFDPNTYKANITKTVLTEKCTNFVDEFSYIRRAGEKTLYIVVSSMFSMCDIDRTAML